jgi:hypothetical protein
MLESIIQWIIQWIIFLYIIYYIRLYVIPLLIVTYLLYLYKYPSLYDNPYGFDPGYINTAFEPFMVGMILSPITFILAVFGIYTSYYPKLPGWGSIN